MTDVQSTIMGHLQQASNYEIYPLINASSCLLLKEIPLLMYYLNKMYTFLAYPTALNLCFYVLGRTVPKQLILGRKVLSGTFKGAPNNFK